MMTRFGSKKFMNKLEPVSTYKHICITDVVSGTEFQCLIYIPKNKIFNILQFWRLKLTRNTMPDTRQKYTFDA
jgi:hypothetical protein